MPPRSDLVPLLAHHWLNFKSSLLCSPIVDEIENNLDTNLLSIAHHSIQSWDTVRCIIYVATSAVQELEENSARPRICIDTAKSPDTGDLQLRLLYLLERGF